MQLKRGKTTSISTRRDLDSMGSSEDVTSDKSSIALDAVESSLSSSSSVQDTKVIPAPSKVITNLLNMKRTSVVFLMKKKNIVYFLI